MKIFVRAFALALVATGAVATIQVSTSTASVVSAKTTMPPVPMCPPGNGQSCGIEQLGY